ncbi:hypothetical protein AKO1_009564 [Acrasis kona]|uniref:Uncharacterized protein n=1 Tax=Acrasis kona TaxID=1008807 RepID=A0AAW2ZL39_9EUKA
MGLFSSLRLTLSRPNHSCSYNCDDEASTIKDILIQLECEREKVRELSAFNSKDQKKILVNELTDELRDTTVLKEMVMRRERVHNQLLEDLKPYYVMQERTTERVCTKKIRSKRVRFSQTEEFFDLVM